ncbi:MAG: hypothetical protein M3P96_11575 [Actinomycetota bacterium]|nr:hypothetical protein [Actinomycetota bacterium]
MGALGHLLVGGERLVQRLGVGGELGLGLLHGGVVERRRMREDREAPVEHPHGDVVDRPDRRERILVDQLHVLGQATDAGGGEQPDAGRDERHHRHDREIFVRMGRSANQPPEPERCEVPTA